MFNQPEQRGRMIAVNELLAGRIASAYVAAGDHNMGNGTIRRDAQLWTGQPNAEYSTTVTVDHNGMLHLWGVMPPAATQPNIGNGALVACVHDLTHINITHDDLTGDEIAW